MIINWNEDFRIRAGDYQWLLEKKVGTRKKRHGAGFEDNWKPVSYHRDPCLALRRLIDNEIMAQEGEYSAGAFEPLIEGLNAIELLVVAFEDQFKHLLKAGPNGASIISEPKGPSDTSANDNDPQRERQKG